MISYQTYKLITESSFALGIKSPSSIGIAGSRLQEMGFERDDNPDMLDGDMGDFPPEESGEEMGMGDPNMDDMDGGDMEGESDPCPACNHDGSKDEEACANDENCRACEACGGTGWLPADDMGDDMDDEMGAELDGAEDDIEMGGDAEDDIEMGGDPSMKPQMFSRKYMCGQSGCGTNMKKMRKENTSPDDDFFSSLRSQAKGNIGDKNTSGIAEEILIAMDGQKQVEPGPGEVGFAPQVRMNQIGNGFSMDDFKELPTLGQ